MENNSKCTNSARKTYTCHVCYRTFFRLHRLQSHIRTHKKQTLGNVNTKYLKKTPVEEISKLIQNAKFNNKDVRFKKILPFAQPDSQNGAKNNINDDSTISSTSAEETLTSNVQRNVERIESSNVQRNVERIESSNRVDNSDENSSDSENLSIEIPVSELITNQNIECNEQIELFGDIENEVVVKTSDDDVHSTDKQKCVVSYDCKLCPKKFSNKCHFARHLLTHTKEKPHVCKVCGRAFAQIGNLSKHFRVHSPNYTSRRYPQVDTDHSGQQDPKKYSFKSAKAVACKRKDQLYPCDICDKEFKNKCYLERHSLTHSKEKPHVCKVCNKGFAQIGNLNVHYKIHSNEKNFVCYICDKAFTHVSALKTHMVTHSDHKPHRCSVCNKGFANPCFLKRHSLIHLKLKPYICKVCKKGFAQTGNLNVHMLTHYKPQLFQCNICKVTVVSQSCFEEHCVIHIMDEMVNQVVKLTECSETDAMLTRQNDECNKLATLIKLPQSSSGRIKSKITNQRNSSSILIKRSRFHAKARKSIRIKRLQ